MICCLGISTPVAGQIQAERSSRLIAAPLLRQACPHGAMTLCARDALSTLGLPTSKQAESVPYVLLGLAIIDALVMLNADRDLLR